MSDVGQPSEQTVAATAAGSGINRDKLIRYSLFFIVMGLYTLPLLGVVVNPPSFLANSATGQLTLLVIHEFAGFAFVGHTLFSNIWAMRIADACRSSNRCNGPSDAAQDGARHHDANVDHCAFSWADAR